MASNLHVLPSIPPAPTIPAWPPKAYVEAIESSEGDDVYSPASTASSPTISSRNSMSKIQLNEEDVEEIAREAAPLCRLDGAHEVAVSFFGCVPTKNFGRVMREVYRSSFPQDENLSFMRALGLRTILTLVPEEYNERSKQFVTDNGIKHVRVRIQPNKDPLLVISQCDIAAALAVVVDPANHPILIHCNKGKHRTGTLVGCLRKVMGWQMERIFEEYRHYAGAKARVLDERYMDLFDERAMGWLARHHGLIEPFERITESPILALTSTRLRS